MYFNRFIITSSVFAFAFFAVTTFFFRIHPDYYPPLISSLAGLIALYMGLIKYWVDTDSMFKSLFESFNLRFDLLNENLNKICEGKELKGKTKDAVIQDYLNLCAEEYYWYKKGRVPKRVWKSWLQGIEYYLKNEEINIAFKKQSKYNNSYYGFFNSIKFVNTKA